VNDNNRSTKNNSRELPCIWMLAGVLNYKLCHRQYECEQCEVNMALQGIGEAADESGREQSGVRSEYGGSAADKQVATYLSQIMEGSKLYLDRCYSQTNFWLRPGEENDVILGLDENLLRILLPITRIVPPDPGRRLQRDQFCSLIVRDDMTIPLHSPISGEVIEVNTEGLSELTGSSCRPGQQADWMFRINPAEDVNNIADLCRGEEMLRWYLGRIRLLKQYLRDALSDSAVDAVGVTMADGGESEVNLETILGTESYQNLIREIF